MWFSSVSDIVKSDFTLFCNSFEKHFGDFDPVATANSQLRALRQEHCGSAANYYSRYNELCSRVDWSDFTLIDTFCEGLKPRVKSALKYVREKDRPKMFKEFAELCIEFDNLAWREEQDLHREKGETFSTESSKPAPTAFITQMLPLHFLLRLLPFTPPLFLPQLFLSPRIFLLSPPLLPTHFIPSPLQWKLTLCAPVTVVHSLKPNASNASRMVSACIVVQLVI